MAQSRDLDVVPAGDFKDGLAGFEGTFITIDREGIRGTHARIFSFADEAVAKIKERFTALWFYKKWANLSIHE
jgi:hypothetical protein